MDDSTCPRLAYLHTHTPTVSNLAPATHHSSSCSVHSLSSLTAAKFPRSTWQLPWGRAVLIFPGLWMALGGGCEFAAWETLYLRPSLVCSSQTALWVSPPPPPQSLRRCTSVYLPGATEPLWLQELSAGGAAASLLLPGVPVSLPPSCMILHLSQS